MKLLKTTLIGIAALSAMICAPSTANAQARFGIKAGTVINKLSLDMNNLEANLSKENRAGFTGGVMMEFTIPVVGIAADASLMYTHMSSGVKYETEQASRSGEANNLESTNPSKNFFQVPINLKYKLTIPAVSNIVKPMIYTGPDFAFKLGGSDNVFDTKAFQFAWNLGIGFEFFNHLQVAGGYSFGCNNILKTVTDNPLVNIPGLSGTNVADDIKMKNSYWSLTAAWLF